jgi:hypothetical protein
MFRFSYTAPYRGEVKSLRFDYKPDSIGLHKDLDGNEWDVQGFGSNSRGFWIMARPKWEAEASGAYSTATNVCHTGGRWIPYYVVEHSPCKGTNHE